MPPPQNVGMTEYNLDVYKCDNCELEGKSIQKDCPDTSDMGIYLLNYIVMLKFNLHGPIKKGAEIP